MKKQEILLMSLCLFSFFNGVLCQNNNMNIFCSVQTMFINQNKKETKFPTSTDTSHKITETNSNANSFSLHQMDLFLSRAFLDNFDAFVDLEFILNYSTDNNWGAFNIEEAWFNYKHSDQLNLKVGWLFPAFNNLNEIKNRLILLPYIIRPLVYEEMFSDLPFIQDYIPEHAYFQVWGTFDIRNLRLDYAAYVGNSAKSYIQTNTTSSSTSTSNIASGLDTRSFDTKLIGGRIGIRTSNETLKAGISITSDKDNQNDSLNLIGRKKAAPLGDVPRIRLGADLQLSFFNFDLESELIKVYYKTPDQSPIEMSEFFINANLLYNFTDKIYAYTGIQGSEDKFSNVTNYAHYFGAGYKFNDYIVGKIQYQYSSRKPAASDKPSRFEDNDHDYNYYFAVAVSLYF